MGLFRAILFLNGGGARDIFQIRKNRLHKFHGIMLIFSNSFRKRGKS